MFRLVITLLASLAFSKRALADTADRVEIIYTLHFMYPTEIYISTQLLDYAAI